MRLASLVLWLGVVAFAGAGLAFLLAPGLLRFVDLTPTSATARSDVRAVFGGLELALAVFLGVCARRPAWHQAGLLAEALAFGGLAAGRLLSLATDGVPGALTFALWGPELLGAALAVVALRRHPRDTRAPGG
jgi:hypothetical protein